MRGVPTYSILLLYLVTSLDQYRSVRVSCGLLTNIEIGIVLGKTYSNGLIKLPIPIRN